MIKISLLLSLLTFILSSESQTKQNPVSKRNITIKQNIIIIDSTSSFNTIEEVLQLPQFQNKVVYIDLWGTTCVPCIREFSYEKQLREKYKNKPVDFLFICYNFHDTANDEWRKKWKDLVYKHRLQGIHVYAYILPPNKIIHQVIDRNFLVNNDNDGKGIAYGIPTFMLAKDGKIVNYEAFRPSDGDKLYKQIDSLLNNKP